jgi:hypothetical protein
MRYDSRSHACSPVPRYWQATFSFAWHLTFSSSVLLSIVQAVDGSQRASGIRCRLDTTTRGRRRFSGKHCCSPSSHSLAQTVTERQPADELHLSVHPDCAPAAPLIPFVPSLFNKRKFWNYFSVRAYFVLE